MEDHELQAMIEGAKLKFPSRLAKRNLVYLAEVIQALQDEIDAAIAAHIVALH